MSGSAFTSILAEIMRIHQLAKGNLRFGQIVSNALPERFGFDPYYVDDHELLQMLEIERRQIEDAAK